MLSPDCKFTREWHEAAYPAVSPSRPEVSAAGKTIIITGAGSGLGRETARAFAEAGAARIAVLARRENRLLETKKIVETEFSKTRVTVHAADVTDAASLRKVAAEVGGWDVLVLNAGYLSSPAPIVSSDVEEWWKGFEINVKGVVLGLQAFTPSKKPGAAVIGISASVITAPSTHVQRYSAYVSSKIAVNKVFEIFAAENPDVHASLVHPGVLATDMYEKSGMEAAVPRDQTDDVSLPAHFMVWAVSDEAKFTRGKFLFANWDVDELKSRAAEIQAQPYTLTTTLNGYPFA